MANNSPSSVYEQNLDLMGSTKTHHFSQRIATFLNPVAKTLNQPTPTPISKPTNPHLKFKQWRHPPTNWAKWVDQMTRKHSTMWKKSGIYYPIMSSIYTTPCNPNIISTLTQFWTPKTNTFVFPWGEVTITLEDAMILGGYSVVGDSVASLTTDLAGKVEVMNKFRSELVRSKSKKASHSKWMQMFMTNTNEHQHVAFLALWLSRFVFPSGDQDSVGKHVIPIAVRLSQGVKLALAPAVLAYIYNNLTRLREQCVDSGYSNLTSCVNLLGPFQLVQIWVYERFSIVGPKQPNELKPCEPRLARWHGLNSNVSLQLLHSHMSNLESFIWRPYAVDLQNWQQPLYYQDYEQILSDSMMLNNDDLQSFVRFITPCELNGLGCKAMYHPHRVAMQFGFDQDIPGDLSSYTLSKFGKFFVPSRSFQPGVSKRYYDWWTNADQMGFEKDQDSLLGERVNASVEREKAEQENCDKKCDFEYVDLSVEDELDDILVSLRKICSATKRKINSLKESCVGVPKSKKERLGSGIGNEASDVNHVIIID